MGDWKFTIYGKKDVIQSRKPVALTIGNFDGVHCGHRHVIQTLKEFSDGLPTVALTFDPPPSHVLAPQFAKPSIEPLLDRVETLLSCGIDVVVVQKFTEDFALLSADQFVRDYLLSQFHIGKVVIGFDFCYGAQRQGDWSHFKSAAARFGFLAKRAKPLLVEGIPVSSSRIRAAVQSLDFAIIEKLLGRPFALSGIVVQGDQRGRHIGFPTANLGLSEESLLLPPFGVYAVEVEVPEEQMSSVGVMNCGVRPTIAEGQRLQIETHILDYSGDLYGKKIVFRLKNYIRSEMKFANLDELKAQIQRDTHKARVFFGV